MRDALRTAYRFVAVVVFSSAAALALHAQDAPQKPAPTQAARPQRTEAEARALADNHRAERPHDS